MTTTHVIEQRGGQWDLLDGERLLGTHADRAHAEAHAQARQAAAAYSETANAIRNVPIFRTGTWNGDPYVTDDLDAMVTAFGTVGFTPPVTVGHTKDPGAPAVGWLENLRREGEALLADIVALPQGIYDSIKQRAFDTVSAEIYWDLERNGLKFPRVLKALALLGAEIPAVNLDPLHKFLSMTPLPNATLVTYTIAAGDANDSQALFDLEPKPVTRAPLVISRDLMRTLCPSCAEAMAERKIARLRIEIDDLGHYKFAEAFKAYAGFSEGLCEKFGGATGFRSRCMDTMSAHVDDAGAFCNSLKIHCHGSAAAESSEDTPARPTAPSTEIRMAEQIEHELRDGEIVTKLSEVADLKRRAAKADEVPALREQIKTLQAEQERLATQRREEQVRNRIASLKIPAFRPFLRVFLDLALAHDAETNAHTYSLSDPKQTFSAESIVQRWVAEMNRQADVLFTTQSVDVRRKDDAMEPDMAESGASAVLEYRARKYMKEHPSVEPEAARYREAIKVVLDADPELKEAYRAS